MHIHMHIILKLDLNVLSGFQRCENISRITSCLWGIMCLIPQLPYSIRSCFNLFNKHFLSPMDQTYSGVLLCIISFSSYLSTDYCQLREQNEPLNHQTDHFLSQLQTLQWLLVSLTVKDCVRTWPSLTLGPSLLYSFLVQRSPQWSSYCLWTCYSCFCFRSLC